MTPPPRSLEIPASPLQPRLAGSPAWRGGPGLPRLGLCGRDRGPLSSQEVRPGQRRLSGFSLESAVGAGPRGGRARQMCSRGRLVAVGPAVGRRRRGPYPWWGPNTITPNTGSERTGRAVPMARSLPVPYPHRLSVGKRESLKMLIKPQSETAVDTVVRGSGLRPGQAARSPQGQGRFCGDPNSRIPPREGETGT